MTTHTHSAPFGKVTELETSGVGSGVGSNSSPTPEEAAAIVAAIERFMHATAPPPAADTPAGLDGWHAAALAEGVCRDPWTPAGDASAWLDNATPG
jgi:hypothetical protein